YVTVNDILLNEGTEHEQRHPYEVFINSKNMDDFQWVVALTRVISAVFRKGGDVTFLVEELKAVFDPKGGYFKKGGRFMPSLVAEIGYAIESHLQAIGLMDKPGLSTEQQAMVDEKKAQLAGADADKQNNPNDDSGYPPSASLCAKCHTKAKVILDGCATCLSCGDSKCG
ncbi:MAG: NrdJb, partial [Gammaproteobacteria bacterium]|nr:NrdJb [Gammaproteobacteria bacterium]